MTDVLVNTDDAELYSLLEYILQAEGFSARLVAGPDDISHGSSPNRTVVILDANSRSLELCRSITDRDHPQPITVIGLVRRDASPGHLELLRAGATECLTRPFNLSALMELICEAAGPEHPLMRPRSQAPHLLLDPLERAVTWQGRTVRLSPIAFALFAELYANYGRVRTRTDLVVAARSPKCILTGRGVDVHVCRLRRSLAPLGKPWIETIRSSGYRMVVPSGDCASSRAQS